MFNFHKDHKMLVGVALGVFVILSLFVSVIPAADLQYVQPLPTDDPMTQMERQGLSVYVSENCMACHTQQVRNIEMDKVWGERPSIPSDYYYGKQRQDFWRQSPSVLGSERTGPDLTNIGQRQPSDQWHLLHLYNPRSVVPESVMPVYKWLFKEKDTVDISEEDVVVAVPKEFFNKPGKKIVAEPEALQLVAYLKSLKQAPMPGENMIMNFIPAKKEKTEGGSPTAANKSIDGKKLYMNTCAACHQQAGSGLPGAFPPLMGSSIVNDKNPELLLQIILQGYDARSEYGVMPAFGNMLTDEEIAAIATYERNNWGNSAPPVSAEDVKRVRDYIESLDEGELE